MIFLLGAIAGDIIGSVYEFNPIKTADFPLFNEKSRFTDDTVLTLALADSILTGASCREKYREYYSYYPEAGYGRGFCAWAEAPDPQPYYSFGNGSAMRVSPVGFAFDNLVDVLKQAALSASVTHNHAEGIKGAQAVASAVFLARTGYGKEKIRKYLAQAFDYPLNKPFDLIRESYRYDVTCQGSVPQAITAFLESESYEDAVRKAVSLGGDSDTIACIAGGIAQAYYGKIPPYIVEQVTRILDPRLNTILEAFQEKYRCAY